MKWKPRLLGFLIGGYILLQGIENLHAHRFVYWNISLRFILYPETQIVVGASVMLISLLPLGSLIRRITTPYLVERKPRLMPFWKRRDHHDQSSSQS
jgi:hypothetical protein